MPNTQCQITTFQSAYTERLDSACPDTACLDTECPDTERPGMARNRPHHPQRSAQAAPADGPLLSSTPPCRTGPRPQTHAARHTHIRPPSATITACILAGLLLTMVSDDPAAAQGQLPDLPRSTAPGAIEPADGPAPLSTPKHGAGPLSLTPAAEGHRAPARVRIETEHRVVRAGSASEAHDTRLALEHAIVRLETEIAELGRMLKWQDGLIAAARTDPAGARRQRRSHEDCRASALGTWCDRLNGMFMPGAFVSGTQRRRRP